MLAGRPQFQIGTRVFDFVAALPERRHEMDGKFGGHSRRSRFMRHTISVLVENKFGVLTRIAGLFSGRSYNIDTLNVAPTQDLSASRMTTVTPWDDTALEPIGKQFNKLVDVLT